MSTLPSLPTTVLGLQGIFNSCVGTYSLLRPAAFAAQMEGLFGGSIPLPMAYLSGYVYPPSRLKWKQTPPEASIPGVCAKLRRI